MTWARLFCKSPKEHTHVMYCAALWHLSTLVVQSIVLADCSKMNCIVLSTKADITVKKESSYKAQYPVLRTVQSAIIHFTSLTDLFTRTPSRLLWEASSHMLQLMRHGCSYTYPPLSIARYSFIQLEHCRVKTPAQVLTPQHRIRTRVLVVESRKLYP